MDSNVSSKKVFLNIFHLPTFMLAIGFLMYWVELYCFDVSLGKTSVIAPVLFILLASAILCKEIGWISAGVKDFRNALSEMGFLKGWLLRTGFLVGFIGMGVAFYASLLPPHLMQESDALVYHYTIPRQHLLLNSFAHIPWSTSDLYLLPLDFALAPYWLCTDLPNKFPQFIFLIGLMLVLISVIKVFARDCASSACLIVLAVLGSHNVGIQMGTAMLDVTICYLLIAALDSFLNGKIWLCALEGAFYFWSKSFIPVQTIIIVAVLFIFYGLYKKIGGGNIGWIFNCKINSIQSRTHKSSFRKIIIYFMLLSLFIAGPFMAKSLYYTGTPLYPFLLGVFDVNKDVDRQSAAWRSLEEKTEQVLSTRNQYGSDRSPKEFLRHLWLIAVPERGVNNRYDYPVGLMYLLCLGPFLFMLACSIKSKEFAIIPLFIVFYWGTWWMGSHQSRFLFVPIVLMFITIFSQKRIQSAFLIFCMLIALSLVMISVFRAHYRDFGHSPREVLREKDKQLIEMSRTSQRQRGVVQLNFHDVAYADFPVDVINNNSVFVIDYREE